MGWIVPRPKKDGSKSYRVCWRDPRGQVLSETCRRYEDARRRLREIEHSMDVGAYRDPEEGKVLFADFWEHFMRSRPPQAPSTRSLYSMQARSISFQSSETAGSTP